MANHSLFLLAFPLLVAAATATADSIYMIAPKASDPRKVIVTKDEGQTWKTSINYYAYTPNGFCITKTTCYLMGTGIGRAFQILKTTNAGSTWTKVVTSILGGSSVNSGTYDMGIYCSDVNNCLFGMWDRVVRTRNGFRQMYNVLTIPRGTKGELPRVTAIECVKGNTVCLVSVELKYVGAIYRSTDSGGTWKRVYDASYELEDMSCVSTPNGKSFCVAAGERGVFYVSTDHGQTWKYLPYKFDKEYFFPYCRWSFANCRLPKKVDSVSCVGPYHCVVAFKGYDTTYDEEQNGALCSLTKYANQEATMKCYKLSRYNKGIKVHCSSQKHCLAITQERYNKYSYGVRYLSYEASIYRYEPATRAWKAIGNKPTAKYGHFQNMIGNQFVYNKDFDFISGGGGMNNGLSCTPSVFLIFSISFSVLFCLYKF